MGDVKEAQQATPATDLEARIMSHSVPKTEQEWWAQREIERLRQQLTTLQAEKERLEGELGRLTTPRPIETAPKDGSHFLIVYNDGEIRMGHYLDNSDKQYPWAGYQSLYGSVGVRKMVGWLPIPTQGPTNGS